MKHRRNVFDYLAVKQRRLWSKRTVELLDKNGNLMRVKFYKLIILKTDFIKFFHDNFNEIRNKMKMK